MQSFTSLMYRCRATALHLPATQKSTLSDQGQHQHLKATASFRFDPLKSRQRISLPQRESASGSAPPWHKEELSNIPLVANVLQMRRMNVLAQDCTAHPYPLSPLLRASRTTNKTPLQTQASLRNLNNISFRQLLLSVSHNALRASPLDYHPFCPKE